jgi:two-component system, cell cycle sensor histidine kinase and response regulator CckA
MSFSVGKNFNLESENNNLFKTMVDFTNEAIMVFNPKGRIVYFNPAAEKLFGCSLAEASKKNYHDFFSPESKKIIDSSIMPSLLRSEGWEGILEGVDVNKKTFPLWKRVDCVWISKQELLFCFSIIHDYSEKLKLESERQLLTTAIEQIAENVIISDSTGLIQYVNPAFEYTTGYSKKEIIGENVRVLKSSNRDKYFYEDMWDSLSKGKIWRGQLTNQKKNGELFEVEATISPVFNSKGKTISYVSVQRDITPRIKLEKQLRQSQKMEAIGTLAGGIAHDFNNLLTAILGYTELSIHLKLENEKLEIYLNEILKGGKRAKELIQQILSFSRQAEGKRKIVQLNPIIKEAMQLLRASIPSIIEIITDIGSDSGHVNVDPVQVHQIVMNLCTNSFHAMRKNGGVLTVSLHNIKLDHQMLLNSSLELPGGEYVKLIISDTGCGISQDDLEHIFEPFFSTKPVNEGSGMGLAVVHGIIKSYEGDVKVSSKPGTGAVFEIFLPITSVRPESSETVITSLQTGSGKILLVDDEEQILKVGKSMLEHLGYEVTTMIDSVEAKCFLSEKLDDFDLLITDYSMPELNGISLCREAKRVNPDFPVILLTGYLDLEGVDKITETEFAGVIYKPILINDLSKLLNNILTP